MDTGTDWVIYRQRGMDNYEVNDSYIGSTVYTRDSSETGPVNGYVALDPSTPGFSGKIKAMEGFFTKIEINANTGEINKFAYPLMMENANDN